MIDQSTRTLLSDLENQINFAIDELIKKRDGSKQASKDKYFYRYVCRKLEQALGSIHNAIDKVEYQNVEFKLDAAPHNGIERK